jgi:hypothetical protein
MVDIRLRRRSKRPTAVGIKKSPGKVPGSITHRFPSGETIFVIAMEFLVSTPV